MVGSLQRIFGRAWLALWWGSRRAFRGLLPARAVPESEAPLAPPERLRLLWVCPYSIYPPIHGGAVRITNLLQQAAREVDVYLLILIGGTDDPEQREALAPWCRGVFFHQIPGRPAADPWGWRPAEAQQFADPLLAERTEALIRAHRIDILQLEYGELGHLTSAAGPARKVLVEIDLAYRSLSRRRRIGAVDSSWFDELRLYRQEVRASSGADQVHFMSAADRRHFAAHLPPSKSLAVVPNGVDCRRFEPGLAMSERRDVLFLGSFPHLPNLDALDWLVAEIWPLVRQRLPGARLTVAGARPPRRVLKLDGRDGIRVLGEVDDVVPLYASHRVLAAPIRAGSGTRLKLLEAFAAGLPTVSTTLGAEGIEAVPGQHFLAADEVSQFAAAILDLLNDETTATRLAGAARGLVERLYDWPSISATQLSAYGEIAPPRPLAEPAKVTPVGEDQGAPRVSIVIDLLPWSSLLPECLAALAEQSSARTSELLVVDWGLAKEYRRLLEESRARVLRPSGAYHQARGLNQAAGTARGELLVFLDANVVVADSGWLDKLADAFASNPAPAASVGLLRQVYRWQHNPRTDPDWTSDFRQIEPQELALSRSWSAAHDGADLDLANAAIPRWLWADFPFPDVPRLAGRHWLRQIEASGRQVQQLPAAVAFRAWGFGWRELWLESWAEGRQSRCLGQRYGLLQLLRELRWPRLLGGKPLAWGEVKRQLADGEADERWLPWVVPIVQFLGNRLRRGAK